MKGVLLEEPSDVKDDALTPLRYQHHRNHDLHNAA
jgi:hypothetical protein